MDFPLPTPARKREAIRLKWRYIEEAGFFAVRAMARRPGTNQETTLKLQCLMCPRESADKAPQTFISCGISSTSNLKKHVKRIHFPMMIEFENVIAEHHSLRSTRERKGGSGGKKSGSSLEIIEINTRRSGRKSLQTRSRTLGYQSDDSDDNQIIPENVEKSSDASDIESTDKIMDEEKKVCIDRPWESMFDFFYRLSHSEGPPDDETTLHHFRCLFCDPDSSDTISCTRLCLSNLRDHIQREHEFVFDKFEKIWRDNNLETNDKDIDRMMTNASREKMKQFDNDNPFDDEVEASTSHYQKIEAQEKYPWDFLESEGFFTLIGASMFDKNDRNCMLKFQCLMCDAETPTVINCQRNMLTQLKKHVYKIHPQAFQQMENLWKFTMKKYCLNEQLDRD